MTYLNAILLVVGIPLAIGTGLMIIIGAQRAQYEENITFFENAVKSTSVTRENYYELSREFDEILKNNCDYGRTNRAYKKFIKRFHDVIKNVA